MTDDLPDRTNPESPSDTVVKPVPARRRTPRSAAPGNGKTPAGKTPAGKSAADKTPAGRTAAGKRSTSDADSLDATVDEATVEEATIAEADETLDTDVVGDTASRDKPGETKPAKVRPAASASARQPSRANLRRQAKKEMARRAAEARRRAKRRRKAMTSALVAGLAVVLAVGGFLLLGNHGKKANTSPTPAASVSLDPALSSKPTVTKGEGDLTELKVTTLITGTGPKVTTGQTIKVNYVGVTYADGKEFDSSWSRNQPAEFPIGVGQVIAGWDKGLVGVTVGSRVQLDIPSALAYPNPQKGQPAGALRFVVDILAATDASS